MIPTVMDLFAMWEGHVCHHITELHGCWGNIALFRQMFLLQLASWWTLTPAKSETRHKPNILMLWNLIPIYAKEQHRSGKLIFELHHISCVYMCGYQKIMHVLWYFFLIREMAHVRTVQNQHMLDQLWQRLLPAQWRKCRQKSDLQLIFNPSIKLPRFHKNEGYLILRILVATKLVHSLRYLRLALHSLWRIWYKCTVLLSGYLMAATPSRQTSELALLTD